MRKFFPVNQLPDVLVLGAQTEHGVTELCFECSVWLDIWPELELSIWVTPPAGDQYPAGTRMDGKILIWPVSAADTACVGKGRMEIMGVSEGKKKLSAIADTLITATSTDTSPNPPPAHEAWVEKVALDALAAKNAAGEAEEFARAAEEAKETAIEAANAVGDVIGAKNEALEEISNQKEASVKAVQNQQAESVKAVREQQGASVSAVDQAKSAAVKALQDESVNQQNAVVAKGKETVDSIPTDYTNLVGRVGHLSEEMLTKAPAIECEASGSIITITDAAAQSAVQFISHIEPVQEGEGDPSPDNVRPISGWDKVRAMRANRNLLRYPYAYSGSQTVNGVVFTLNGDGTITANGTATALAQFAIIPTNETQHIPAGLYAISGCPEGGSGSGYYIKLGIVGEGERKEVGRGVTFALNKTTRIYVYCSIESGTTVDNITFAPMLRKVDGESGYEPTRTQPLTADLPETVYGGTLDWTTGEMLVTYGKNVIDGMNMGRISITSGGKIRYSPYPAMRSGRHFSDTAAVCDKLVKNENLAQNSVNNAIQFGGGNQFCTIEISGVNTIDSAGEWFAQNPVTIIYPRATPYTIQLTPQQLDMLKGVNNVWSDCGDTSLVYVADTKLYIDGKFSELQNAILAQGANI